MAALKKGSKGKPVEELQTLVNKLGIKPALKVDGLFGPLTEKGVKAAQKKLKAAKVDGFAGDETLAALRFGKPLPVMRAPNYAGEIKKCTSVKDNTQKQEKLYGAINLQIDVMNKAIDEIVWEMMDLSTSTLADLQTVMVSGVSVNTSRKLFESARLSKPGYADTLAEDAYAEYLVAEAAKKRISERLAKVGPEIAKKRKTVVSAYTTAEKHLAELEKAVAEGKKKLTALNA
ncbi:MAG: peptidoglycan-binding protein [Pseudomonadota bacterium]